jgi:hypothetical protein
MPVSRRIPQASTSIGTLSMKASVNPREACVRPAPGTTLTQASCPEARQTASAMNDGTLLVGDENRSNPFRRGERVVELDVVRAGDAGT